MSKLLTIYIPIYIIRASSALRRKTDLCLEGTLVEYKEILIPAFV